MKIYTKVGKPNYKEKKMLKAIAAKLSENPDLNVGTASNIEELQAIYNSIVGDEAEIISETSDVNKDQKNMAKDVEDVEFTLSNEKDIDLTKTNTEPFVDPFNRQSAIVRDYVTEQQFEKADSEPATTVFDEPKDFADAFYIPPAEGEGTVDIENNGGNQQSGSVGPQKGDSTAQSNAGAGPKKQSQNVVNPLNPAYNDMDKKTKNRQNKRFAKFAVNAVCFMAEKGLVWLGTSNINQAKVIEYEAAGEFDLDTILNVGEAEMSVREFFATRVSQVEDISKISDPEKDDLIESLAALLEEKGFTPTPMQTFLMNAGEVILTRAAAIAALRFENKGIIDQLKEIRLTGASAQRQYEESQIQEEEENMENPATMPMDEESNIHAKNSEVIEPEVEVLPAITRH